MDKIIDFYSDINREKVGSEKNSLGERLDIFLDFVLKNIKEEDNLLDIGCGDGFFLSKIEGKSDKVNLFGVEYSENQYRLALNNLKNAKIENYSIEDGLRYDDNTFDFICAGKIVEHLYNPEFFMKEVSRILKPGGYFIFSTPNLHYWVNRVLFLFGVKPFCYEFSCEENRYYNFLDNIVGGDHKPAGHIRIFNKKFLEDLSRKNNFNTVEFLGIPSLIKYNGRNFLLKILFNIYHFFDIILSRKVSFSSNFVVILKKNI